MVLFQKALAKHQHKHATNVEAANLPCQWTHSVDDDDDDEDEDEEEEADHDDDDEDDDDVDANDVIGFELDCLIEVSCCGWCCSCCSGFCCG